ncbi:MAG: hypothetical protein ABID83_03665, partial [Candidatus Omnitrophota bacterium]
PARISNIKNMVTLIDRRTPQIILDAKVIEITLTKDERFGVDWNAVISAAGAKRPITFPFDNTGIIPFLPGSQRDYYARASGAGAAVSDPNISTTIPTIDVATLANPLIAATDSAIFSFGTLDFSTFTATLSMLDQRGDTEILSSPRITTLDNQKATIKVVEKIMLQKTSQTTQTAGIVTVEFETVDDAREAGVKLTVIPHVNEKGEISVNLLPEVSTNEGFGLVNVGVAGAATSTLTFSSREANTTVRVKDGDTIFLGGLISKRTVKVDNKFPILGDIFGGIPVLGNAFKYESDNVTRTEIVFFVTVNLVKDGMDTIRASQSMTQYNRYYPQKEGENAGSEQQAEQTRPVIMKEKLKVSEKKEEIPIGIVPVAEGIEKRKPFLDFRKK